MSRHRCHCENPPAIHTRPLVIARSAATWQSTPFLSFLFHKLKTKTWIATLLASLFPRNDRKGEAFDACRCLSSFFMASLPLSLLTTVVIARAKGPWQSRLCLLKSKRYGLPRHSLRSFLAMTGMEEPFTLVVASPLLSLPLCRYHYPPPLSLRGPKARGNPSFANILTGNFNGLLRIYTCQ